MKQKNITSTSDLNELYDQLHIVSELRFPLEDYPHFLRLLNRIKKLRNENKILDIGCGQGFLLKEAEKMGLECYGIDISRIALQKAKEMVPDAKVIRGDAENLPYPDNYFDFVVNLGSLEHFLNIDRALREMARICKPDGMTLIVVPNLYYIGTVWKVYRTGYGEDQGQEGTSFFTFEEWKTKISENNLHIISIKGYNGFDHINWFFKRKNRSVASSSEKMSRYLLNTFLKPFIPLNLSQCFIFFAEKNITENTSLKVNL